MRKELLSLKKSIKSTTSRDNIVCILLYGSILEDNYKANDLDAIVIVKKIDSTLKDIFRLFSNISKNLDIHTYTEEEIYSGLSFYTREFILEYLSNESICIWGKNILKPELLKINPYQYKQSILIRSIERVQMIRKKYFTSSISKNEKLKYLKKYFLRISKSLLILEDKENNTSLKNLKLEEITKKLFDSKIISYPIDFNSFENLDECFNLFSLISKELIILKKNFIQDDVRR